MTRHQRSVPLSPVFTRVLRQTVVLAAAGTMVSGCAVAQFGSLFGGGAARQEVTGAIGGPVPVQEQSLATASAGLAATPVAVRDLTDSACPRVSVEGEEGQLTVYEVGRIGDSLAIRHRGEITKAARECEMTEGEVKVKYGLAGRVLLGPLGQPGTVRLPVIVSVADRAKKVVKTQKIDVSVTVEANKPFGNFSIVEHLAIPVAQGTLPGDYAISVTFDKKVAGAS